MVVFGVLSEREVGGVGVGEEGQGEDEESEFHREFAYCLKVPTTIAAGLGEPTVMEEVTPV